MAPTESLFRDCRASEPVSAGPELQSRAKVKGVRSACRAGLGPTVRATEATAAERVGRAEAVRVALGTVEGKRGCATGTTTEGRACFARSAAICCHARLASSRSYAALTRRGPYGLATAPKAGATGNGFAARADGRDGGKGFTQGRLPCLAWSRGCTGFPCLDRTFRDRRPFCKVVTVVRGRRGLNKRRTALAGLVEAVELVALIARQDALASTDTE